MKAAERGRAHISPALAAAEDHTLGSLTPLQMGHLFYASQCFTYDEIAEQQGVAASTVRNSLHRARRRFLVPTTGALIARVYRDVANGWTPDVSGDWSLAPCWFGLRDPAALLPASTENHQSA
jgi:DNA-binding CsgD family transcriptional regulator